MTRHDPQVALRQMRDFAMEAVEMSATADRAALDSDRRLFLALTRLVELVGEASTRIDDATRASPRCSAACAQGDAEPPDPRVRRHRSRCALADRARRFARAREAA